MADSYWEWNLTKPDMKPPKTTYANGGMDQKPQAPTFLNPPQAPSIDPAYQAMEKQVLALLQGWGNGTGLPDGNKAADSYYNAGKARLDDSFATQMRQIQGDMAGRGMYNSGIRQSGNAAAWGGYNTNLMGLSSDSEQIRLQQQNANQQIQMNALSSILGYTPIQQRMDMAQWQANTDWTNSMNGIYADMYNADTNGWWQWKAKANQGWGGADWGKVAGAALSALPAILNFFKKDDKKG